MRFDSTTLRSTAKAFGNALKIRGLSLPHSSELDAWSKLITGKDHPTSIAQFNASAPTEASCFTPETLQKLLAKRRRKVSTDEAMEIIAESIAPALQTLSPCMATLLGELCNDLKSCLSEAIEPTMGIGYFTAELPGYLPAGSIPQLRPFVEEFAWIKRNNKLVIEVLNRLSKKGGGDYAEIMVSSIRASEEAKDKACYLYLFKNVSRISEAIASDLLREYELDSWGLIEYADIRFSVLDCFERLFAQTNNRSLTPHCSLGEAVIDHIAGRLWDSTQLFGNASELPHDFDPKELLQDSTTLAINRILKPIG